MENRVIPKSSILCSVIRTINSNSFLKNQLEKENNSLSGDLQLYYDKFYKSNASFKLDDEIFTSFDPYAIFFSNSKDSLEVLDYSLDMIFERSPSYIYDSEDIVENLKRKGISKDLAPHELKQRILTQLPLIEAWNMITTFYSAQAIELRTRFFDHFINLNIDTCQQYVILGAGLDSRAYHMGFKEGTTVWEVDYAEILNYKYSVLSKAVATIPKQSKAMNVHISSDILDLKWIEGLESTDFRCSKPTVWILEGLIMYLSEPEIDHLFSVLFKLSGSGSAVLVQTVYYDDINNQKTLVGSVFSGEYKSTSNTPSKYLERAGFTKDLNLYTSQDLWKLFNIQKPCIGSISYCAVGYKP